jgi:hypothetical protein
MENIPSAIEVPETKPLPIPQSIRLRFLYALAVTVLPILCFISIDILKPDWQSGKFSDYVALFLSPKAAWIFFPLIAYSSISLLILLLSPKRYVEFSWTRFGIYTGTFIALQFTILTFLVLLDEFFIVLAAWVIPFVVIPIYHWLVNKWGARKINIIISGLLFIGILFQVMRYLDSGNAFTPVFFLLGWMLISAPFWSLLIMGQTSLHLLKNYETKLTFAHGIGSVIWLVAFIEAWRFGILKTLELYAALPANPPNCYIATAAARGHARIVGSREVILANGQSMRVNAQLQRLKCGELALLETFPYMHKTLRIIYDVVGKKLARRMQNPFLADVAYIFLKPFEWITILALQLFAPQAIKISNKLYTH